METNDRFTTEDCERIYQNALILIEGGLYSEAADELARIPDYKDAAQRRIECEEKSAVSRLDRIYDEADKAAANRNVRSQEKAIQLFEKIRGHKDADERIEQAKRAIEEITAKERADREEAIRAAKEAEAQRKLRNKRIIRLVIIGVLAAAACVAGVFLFKKYAVPALQYRRGVKEMEAGAYDDAYITLHGMNYRDSNDLVLRIEKERLQNAEVGSVVLFGEYTQGNILDDEVAPIEWIVLEKDGSRLLLISKYALDTLPYMRFNYASENIPVTWRTSFLREWLNGPFLNTVFDNGEAALLQYAKLVDNAGTDSEQRSIDRVFLLSAEEAIRYFHSDEERKCVATKFALGYGAYRSSVDYTCMWWLRTPVDYTGPDAVYAADMATYAATRIVCVGTSGQIINVGHDILNRGYAVRPAVWVDTENDGKLIFNK